MVSLGGATMPSMSVSRVAAIRPGSRETTSTVIRFVVFCYDVLSVSGEL